MEAADHPPLVADGVKEYAEYFKYDGKWIGKCRYPVDGRICGFQQEKQNGNAANHLRTKHQFVLPGACPVGYDLGSSTCLLSFY